MIETPLKQGWALEEIEGNVHVLPFNDAVGHDGEDCICGTTVEPCPREDGSMGWLIIHYSLDGRENRED